MTSLPHANLTTHMLQVALDGTRASLGLPELSELSASDSASLQQFTDMTVAEFCMLLRLLQIDSKHCCHNPARLESAAMAVQHSRANPWQVLRLSVDKTWACDGLATPMVRVRLAGSVVKPEYAEALEAVKNLLLSGAQ